MEKYIKYLKYIIRHKYYVFIEAYKHGIIWRGILHDLSKLLPSEFMPYVNYFYGTDTSKNVQDNNGYYKPKNTGDSAFEKAWFLHQKRNKHHWQWWILKEDDSNDTFKTIPMESKYAIEMVCDWVGAGKAQGKESPKDDPYREVRLWYDTNKHKIILHPYTRNFVEDMIGYKK